jgi:DNA invertase Pin-like site-specific DNA recombinase
MNRPLIGYVRVSTSQQGRSGLGLEAQQQALARFAQAEGFMLTCVTSTVADSFKIVQHDGSARPLSEPNN